MKRKDDILLSRKQILTVCLRSEIFPQQNSNFQGENCPQIYNFWLKLPFWYPVQVFLRIQTIARMISFI